MQFAMEFKVAQTIAVLGKCYFIIILFLFLVTSCSYGVDKPIPVREIIREDLKYLDIAEDNLILFTQAGWDFHHHFEVAKVNQDLLALAKKKGFCSLYEVDKGIKIESKKIIQKYKKGTSYPINYYELNIESNRILYDFSEYCVVIDKPFKAYSRWSGIIITSGMIFYESIYDNNIKPDKFRIIKFAE